MMTTLPAHDPLATAVTLALHAGDTEELRRLLAGHPELARTRVEGKNGGQRSLLHLAVDAPGHRPRTAEIIATLVAAGADVNAPFVGRHAERPLHWAASNDDVAALDALVAAGADLDAEGGVFGNGTPLDDAVIFGQWRAARRLVERGARVQLHHAAALGLLERVRADAPHVSFDERTRLFWNACRGNQLATAQHLLGLGADPTWVGYDDRTALAAAEQNGASDVVRWLESIGARPGAAAAHETRSQPIRIDHIDHVVLTVASVDRTCAFYADVLGMEVRTFGGGRRRALHFGVQKINLHEVGRELEPKAAAATAGSGDLCFIAATPIDAVVARLAELGVPIVQGPVDRTGATGPIRSVYVKDPDGNLIEIANPKS